MPQLSSSSMSVSNCPSLRPPLRSEDARTQRHLLQAELRELWGTIVVKRAHLNNLAPISYIPPEILGRIFYEVSRGAVPRLYHGGEDHALYLRGFRMQPLRSLVNITHVCSRWRQIAIEHSTLWFYPPLELGLDWVKTTMLRSGSVPLIIEAHHCGPLLLPEMIPCILEHLSHVQTLHISSYHDVLSQLIPKLIQPAAMLASLTVDQPQNWSENHNGGVVSRLPQNLFAGCAAKLREVSLLDCIVPWDCTVFQNLASLFIRVPAPRVERLLCAIDGVLTPLPRSDLLPSMSQLLTVLKASPRLRSLGLSDVLPRASSIPFHPAPDLQNVRLRYLEDLSLTGTLQECTALLSHVALRTRAKLHLELSFVDAESTEAQYSAFFDVLEHHYCNAHFKVVDAFWHFRYSDSEFELSMEADLCHITIPMPVDIATRTNFLYRYFATIPLAEAWSLTFDDDRRLLALDRLTQIFAHEHLHGIYEMTIQQGRIDAFVAALSILDDGPVPTFLMFPFLTQLEIDEIDFTEFTHRQMVSLQSDFVSLLQEREEHGCPIERVEFRWCAGLSEAWTDALRVVESTEICFKAG